MYHGVRQLEIFNRLAVVGALAMLAFNAAQGPAKAREISPETKRARLMAGVQNWGYQLQKLNTTDLAASPFDLIVIDHAPDRVESVELTFRRAEIEALKVKPGGGRRLVLAYVSIGEAERYRFYWDDGWLEAGKRPTWLGADNPQWAGNYPVEFWNPDWQRLIYGASDSYLERVMEAGFDGVYLDRADVYQQFPSHPTAEAEMADFVIAVADHVRSLKPDALVVMQNAEELLRRKPVRARVDAIAKESLYLNPEAAAPATPADTRDSISDLRLVRKAGHKVMVVEYTADATNAAAARKRAEADGFLIHFAERSLSKLNVRGPDQQVTAGDPEAAPLAPLH